MSLLARLKMLKIFIHLLLNADRTDLIFQAVDLLTEAKDQTRVKRVEQSLLAHPEFKKMYDENYKPETPSLEKLGHCAPGTFGNAVYLHMTRNGLDFSIWPHLETKRAIRYMSERAYFDHDLWHALVGYGTEIEEELALLSFNIAQIESPLPIMLISGSLLKMLVKEPEKAVRVFGKIVEGYNIGKQARFLLGVRLHDYFNLPLSDVREICQITPPKLSIAAMATETVSRQPAAAREITALA